MLSLSQLMLCNLDTPVVSSTLESSPSHGANLLPPLGSKIYQLIYSHVAFLLFEEDTRYFTMVSLTPSF